jgi:predicted small lipoprotein YifL
MHRIRISFLLLALAVLPFALAACGKGGGGY